MRRPSPDLTYKDRTRQLIEANLESWQLPYKDPREGFHRLVNRVVSLSEEFNTELEYVQDMFFPDRIDLSEEYVVYRSMNTTDPYDIYLSGISVSGLLREAESLDDFIGGLPDVLILEHTVSGMPVVSSLVGDDLTRVMGYQSGMLYQMNLLNEVITQSGSIENRVVKTVTTTFDTNNRYLAILDDIRVDTIDIVPLLPESGYQANRMIPSGIPYSVLGPDDLTGLWNASFDIDNNKYIGDYELGIAMSLRGADMRNYTPEVWTEIAWADVNGDGIIDDHDIKAIKSAYRSAAPDVHSVIEVPASVAASCSVTYELAVPLPAMISRGVGLYRVHMDNDPITSLSTRITYDEKTDIYYGITEDGTQLVAFRFDPVVNSVVGDQLVYVERWDPSCRLLDVDCMWGYLFVLVSDGSTYELRIGDIWGEYVETIERSVLIEFPDDFAPTAMSLSSDGYMLFSNANGTMMFRLGRDKFLAMNGELMFNRKHDLTISLSGEVKLVPQYIFNNWDSFAFSFGIERPWGVNNLQMKRLLYDFYRHKQGHSMLGMAYGIHRELGYVNPDVYNPDIPVTLPFTLITSGEISVDSVAASVSAISDTQVSVMSYLGQFTLQNGFELYPSSGLVAAARSFVLGGLAIDGNGDGQSVTWTVNLPLGVPVPPLKVRTMADPAYLTEQGYIVSGVPTSGLVELVSSYEDSNHAIYRNAITNTIPFDAARFSPSGLIATAYDPSLSGVLLVSDEIEVDL